MNRKVRLMNVIEGAKALAEKLDKPELQQPISDDLLFEVERMMLKIETRLDRQEELNKAVDKLGEFKIKYPEWMKMGFVNPPEFSSLITLIRECQVDLA
jgi:hypothetical protein